MLRGSTPIQLQQLDISPAIQAGALEQQAAVNLASGIQNAIQNFQVKQEQKKQEKIGISAIQSMLGIDDPNLAKAVYKDPAVRDAYQKQSELAAKSKGTVLTFEQIQSYKNQGYDVDATPLDDDTFLATKISPFAGPSTVIQNGGDDGLATEIIRDEIKNINKRSEDVIAFVDTLPNLEAMENILAITDESGIITGFGGDIELNLKRLGNKMGFDFDDVSTTQTYLSLAGNQVAQVIKAFGAGTGLSDADREFAKSIAGADQTLDKKTLQRLVRIMKEKGKGILENYNKYVDSISQTQGLDETSKDFISRKKIPEEMYVDFFDYETDIFDEPSDELVPDGLDPKLWELMTESEKAAFR